jgi:hypothetical protein
VEWAGIDGISGGPIGRKFCAMSAADAMRNIDATEITVFVMDDADMILPP